MYLRGEMNSWSLVEAEIRVEKLQFGVVSWVDFFREKHEEIFNNLSGFGEFLTFFQKN